MNVSMERSQQQMGQFLPTRSASDLILDDDGCNWDATTWGDSAGPRDSGLGKMRVK